jgi:hypothetical protein
MTDPSDGRPCQDLESRGLGARVFRHRLAEAVLADSGVEEDPRLRARVLAFVDERVASMPSHLRLGVRATEWILLLISRGGRGPAAHGARGELPRRLRRWGSSRLPPVTQYVRLIRSLVLLAAHEFAEEREGADRW